MKLILTLTLCVLLGVFAVLLLPLINAWWWEQWTYENCNEYMRLEYGIEPPDPCPADDTLDFVAINEALNRKETK